MTIAYEVVGDGPAVVLICGLGGAGRFWEPTARLLAPRFRVISFDHPGIGGSARCPGPASIGGIADAALEAAHKAGVDRFAVVGHSTGGLVAQALALDEPQRVRALVLSCTWAAADARFRRLFELRKRVLLNDGLQAYEDLGDLLAYPQDFYDTHGNGGRKRGEDGEGASEAFRRTTAERIDMLLSYSRLDELPGLRMATHIIGAVDDWIVPVKHARQLASVIPAAGLTEMSGGHFLPRTQAQAYARAVATFLERAEHAEN